jgi:amidase
LNLSTMLTAAWEIPPNTPKNYTQFTKDATFKGFRLGVPRNVFFTLQFIKSQQIIDEANAAIARIASLGATIQDPADLPSAEEILTSNAELTVTRNSHGNI